MDIIMMGVKCIPLMPQKKFILMPIYGWEQDLEEILQFGVYTFSKCIP
jgi:hypothetical protein